MLCLFKLLGDSRDFVQIRCRCRVKLFKEDMAADAQRPTPGSSVKVRGEHVLDYPG